MITTRVDTDTIKYSKIKSHFQLVVESLKEAGSGALTTLTEREDAKRLIQALTS